MPALAAIAPYIAAAAAVATTVTSIQSAQKANSNAKNAKNLAAEKLGIQQRQATAEAKQQRSLTARRLATQLDASRVLSGASGVGGGASQLVLESAYAADARNDLTTISANQARANQGFDANYRNNIVSIDSQTPSMGAAAFGGIAQGFSTGLSIYDSMGRLGVNTTTSTTTDGMGVQYSGTNANPTVEGPIRTT